ncbi:MAG: beta-galactosidase [Candidatus Hydrogenedentes bacterium]|nr:beta-galactosidase [Candidatus Hydrogenedentota bacterium]
MEYIYLLRNLLCHAASGKVLARFCVGDPHEASGLEIVPAPGFETEKRDGKWLLGLRPSGRYYEEDAWEFRFTDVALRARKELVLEADFFDEDYGVIVAQWLADGAFKGRYVPADRSVSYTRLNTRQDRTAAFHFSHDASGDNPQGHPDFQITGLQHLCEVRILDSVPESYWDDLQKKIPRDVPPAVTLQRPMDIVCSAGARVLGARDEILKPSIESLREQVPLAKALGFNGVEAYVRWDFVEPAPGKFDWSYYDAIVEEIRRYGLKWFPLLIVGSAYSLPEWFINSEEYVEFICLEHRLGNPIQSIWSPHHKKHVTRFLQEFGRHYEPMQCLLGVRLGPSGNYGESQYPAQGDWGFKGQKMHLHIGMWAGDPYALEDFRGCMRRKYQSVEALNDAWRTRYPSWEDVPVVMPEQCVSRRQRIDLYTWYTDSMTNWCEWWAIEARKAMPNTPIYQSAGGWGAAEIGTDYSGQAKSMLKIDGGIRLTNELDSFHQAFYATRLAATSARCYDVLLGFEPAMGHTARGTAGRIFNCVSNNGHHFFTYGGNVFNQQSSIENWLRHYRCFDLRQTPLVEVAVYYPQTMNFLSPDTFRYLNAWGFNPFAREIRDRIEIDYLDDRLILDGFLDRYKALVFAWGNRVEKGLLDRIDAWLRGGGTVIYPCFLYSKLYTIEDDETIFDRWTVGDVGEGAFFRYRGDDEPPSLYADFVKGALLQVGSLSPETRLALEMERPNNVFASLQSDGHLLILNFDDTPSVVRHPAFGSLEIGPYAIERIPVTLQ